MKLIVWEIGKENLERIPEQERSLVLGLGYIANEINILQKFLYWTIPVDNDSDIHRKAHATQSLVVAKILAAKLSEAWQFVVKGYFKSKLSKDYEELLDVNGKDSLMNLKNYFGRNNILTTVRNDFAFHYELEKFQQGFKIPAETESWQLIMSEAPGNSLYCISDLVLNHSMFSDIGNLDISTGIDKLLKDSILITKYFIAFCNSCWIVLADKYLKGAGSTYKEIEVGGSPALKDIHIPFFIETD